MHPQSPDLFDSSDQCLKNVKNHPNSSKSHQPSIFFQSHQNSKIRTSKYQKMSETSHVFSIFHPLVQKLKAVGEAPDLSPPGAMETLLGFRHRSEGVAVENEIIGFYEIRLK